MKKTNKHTANSTVMVRLLITGPQFSPLSALSAYIIALINRGGGATTVQVMPINQALCGTIKKSWRFFFFANVSYPNHN